MCRDNFQEGAAVPEALGPVTFGAYNKALDAVRQLIFIRHADEPEESESSSSLSPAGYFRADHLDSVFGRSITPPDAYAPDVIYAMRGSRVSSASIRAFETVEPLAFRLGMDPQQNVRTPETGDTGVFDNCFAELDHQALADDVIRRAKNGDYADKTLLFCWEHQSIPHIIARLGLTGKSLHWGLHPESKAHEERNCTAVWVFNPKQRTFKVHRQFDVISGAVTNRHDALAMVPPAGGYESAVYSAELAPCKKVKFAAAILAPPANELEPSQPETPPKESRAKQVEVHDTEVYDMAELGLWNGAKSGTQKARTTGKITLAAEQRAHMGACSGAKAGSTPSKPEVSHAFAPALALPQHRSAVASFVECFLRRDPSGAEIAFPGEWWAAADPTITEEIRNQLTSKGYLMTPPEGNCGVASFVDPWRM